MGYKLQPKFPNPFSSTYNFYLYFLLFYSIFMSVYQIFFSIYTLIQGWKILFITNTFTLLLSKYLPTFVSYKWLKSDLGDITCTEFMLHWPIPFWLMYRLKMLINNNVKINVYYKNGEIENLKQKRISVEQENSDIVNLKLLTCFQSAALMLPLIIYAIFEYNFKNYNESPIFCFEEYQFLSIHNV